MASTSLSIQTFIDSLPENQRPSGLGGRLTQRLLEEHGLLDAFREWRREQYKIVHAARRDDQQRERDRVNQAVSRALRTGRASTPTEALATVNPMWTNRPGPVPRTPRWYAAKTRSLDIREKVLQKLEHTCFSRETHRTGAIREGTGLVFGTVFSRRLNRYGESCQKRSNPTLYSLIKHFASAEVPDFPYTTIQVNKNVVTNPHRDKYNVGPTLIVGLGEFHGGALVVNGKTFSLASHRWLYFWGKDEHYNTPLTRGPKYTITLFTLLPPYAQPTAETHTILGRIA